jgi:hypothetical protein
MLDLQVLPGEYAVCRLPAGAPVPPELHEVRPGRSRGVISVTWTPDEVSIICSADQAPPGSTVETPWRCLRVSGPVNIALTGVLAAIVTPLARERVNIFAFSTYDTDYVLVPAVRLFEATAALISAGHRISE